MGGIRPSEAVAGRFAHLFGKGGEIVGRNQHELMAESPQFSVIVPVYNRIGEVRDLVDSLLAQTSTIFRVLFPCLHCGQWSGLRFPYNNMRR